jgi:FkbM family methyltransferase
MPATNVIFRNGARISLNKETIRHYVEARRLFFSGTMHIGELDGYWELELPNGLRFLVRPHGDDIGSLCEIFLDRYYGLYDLKQKVVIDIGAGIGDSSIYFASMGAKVYAFEPLVDSWNLARMNIELNHLKDRVYIYNKAVSGAAGLLSLKTIKGEPRLTTTSLLQVAEGLYVDAGVAESITLDQIIRQHDLGVIDLLKLDCEGCEFDILDDHNADALAHVRKIVMEYHGNHRDICRFLEKMGFSTEAQETLSPFTRVGTKVVRTAVGRIYAERIGHTPSFPPDESE